MLLLLFFSLGGNRKLWRLISQNPSAARLAAAQQMVPIRSWKNELTCGNSSWTQQVWTRRTSSCHDDSAQESCLPCCCCNTHHTCTHTRTTHTPRTAPSSGLSSTRLFAALTVEENRGQGSCHPPLTCPSPRQHPAERNKQSSKLVCLEPQIRPDPDLTSREPTGSCSRQCGSAPSRLATPLPPARRPGSPVRSSELCLYVCTWLRCVRTEVLVLV